MKQILLNKRSFLSALLVFLTIAGMAQTFTVGDLNYQVNPDGVSGCSFIYEPIVIPYLMGSFWLVSVAIL